MVSITCIIFSKTFTNTFLGCTLSSKNPSVKWSFEEEEDDLDYLQHNLFMRHVCMYT